MHEIDRDAHQVIVDAAAKVLDWVLDIHDPNAPESLDLNNTPERWVKMMQELTRSQPFNFTTFPSDHDEMIVVSNIPLYSLCSHHLIPFIGRAHVAYLPQGRIAGLSKIARTVQMYMRGLWTQEDLCDAVHHFLTEKLNPLGVGVVMQAEHLCMTMRGAQAMGTLTTTSKMSGPFLDHSRQARSEFLELIRE